MIEAPARSCRSVRGPPRNVTLRRFAAGEGKVLDVEGQKSSVWRRVGQADARMWRKELRRSNERGESVKKMISAGALALCAVAVVVPVSGLAAQKPATKALTTKLTGAAEVPNPGDPDGRGKAVVRFNERRGTVCFKITVRDIAGSTAGHIHEAPVGVAGPIRVTLFGTQSADKQRKGCVEDVDPMLVRRILANPGDFYVNVHNAEFRTGAVRGQLRGKPKSR